MTAVGLFNVKRNTQFMNPKYLLPLIGLCFLTACQKDIDEVMWENLPQSTDDVYLTETGAYLNTLFNDLSPVLPSYTYDSAASANITLEDGQSTLSLPGDCFLRENGEAVEGEIEIKALLVKNKGDMIRYRATTKSGADLLDSEVEVFLAAFQNGVSLQFNPDLNYSLNLAIDSLDQSSFGQSGEAYLGQLDENGTLDWYTPAESSWASLELNEWFPSTDDVLVTGYSLSSNTFGWVAASQLVEESVDSNSKLELLLPEEFGNLNTTAFLVLDGYNTVVNLMVGATDEHFEYVGVPSGASGKVFILGVLDGEEEEDVFAEVVSVSLGNSSTETVEALGKRSLSEVQALLNDI